VFFCLQAFGAARVMGAQDKDRRQMVRFEGVLKDARGNPRTGVAGVNFALYKEQEGGPALWLETQNVELDEQGRYAVVLGTMKNEGVPMDWLATGEARWLGIQAYGQPEERVLLVRVPHDANALETVHAAPGIQPQPVSARELPANDNDNGAIHGRGTPGTIAKFTGKNTVGDANGSVKREDLDTAAGFAFTNASNTFTLPQITITSTSGATGVTGRNLATSGSGAGVVGAVTDGINAAGVRALSNTADLFQGFGNGTMPETNLPRLQIPNVDPNALARYLPAGL
jgi:hypothetical protein